MADKDVKYEINVEIYASVDWYSDRSDGDDAGRGNNVRVNSDIGVKFGRSDDEGSETEVCYEFESGDGNIVDKCVKGFIGWS